MGTVGKPESLLNGQEDLHHFQLRPSQVRRLSQADLIIWVGADLTPWLDAAIDANAAATPQLALADHGEAETDSHETHGHDDHHGVDPHVWLDPDEAASWLTEIAEALAELDPENAEIYQHNAKEAQASLVAMSRQIESRLDGHQTIQAITLHDAYGHFEERFDVAIAGHLKDSEATAPSVARMQELQTLNQNGSVKCLFTEPSSDVSVMLTLAGQSGIEVQMLDPLGATLIPGPKLYDDLIENIADKFETCAER